MKFNGKTSAMIDGVKVDFTWNMSAMCMLEELRNKTIAGIAAEISDPSFRFLADFLYVGYITQNPMTDKTRDYGMELLDHIGHNETLELIVNAFFSPKEVIEDAKKTQAPIPEEPS